MARWLIYSPATPSLNQSGDSNMTGSAATRRLSFRGLSIDFNAEVLEPRPWTAAQSAWGAELLDEAPAGPVLELCAGAGHIGLGAVLETARSLVMVDISPAAQRLTEHNAALNNMASQVEFRLARIEEALIPDERFGLIIADPPWVPSNNTTQFPHDPLLAIDGGDDGLDLARTCVDLIDRHLAENASALLQLGSTAQVQLIEQYADQRPEGTVSVQETRVFNDGVLIRLAR